jgi:hypothetical protein
MDARSKSMPFWRDATFYPFASAIRPTRSNASAWAATRIFG